MNLHPDGNAPLHPLEFVIERNLQTLRDLSTMSRDLGVGLMLENLTPQLGDFFGAIALAAIVVASAHYGTDWGLDTGTVLAHGGGGGVSASWYRLTPDNTGSYVNGTWRSIATPIRITLGCMVAYSRASVLMSCAGIPVIFVTISGG